MGKNPAIVVTFHIWTKDLNDLLDSLANFFVKLLVNNQGLT